MSVRKKPPSGRLEVLSSHGALTAYSGLIRELHSCFGDGIIAPGAGGAAGGAPTTHLLEPCES
eukprot:498352-Amphidinium_carterae.1